MNSTKGNLVQKDRLRKHTKIYVFVALECEAKPLVIYFDLIKLDVNHPFLIYKNDEIVLTVTGVGKVAMAGGLAYTLAIFPCRHYPILLNIGIAGHMTKAIGNLVMVVKIIDEDSGKKYYPSRVIKNIPEEASALITVSKPRKYYIQDFLYDMEASAFYEMAVKFSSSELIQSIKVISDNQYSAIENIWPKKVSQWLTNNLNTIESIVKKLLKLQELIDPIECDEYQKIIKKWHFTVSGQIKLKAQLLRWSLLSSDIWLDSEKENLKCSKKVLQMLEKDINNLEFHL